MFGGADASSARVPLDPPKAGQGPAADEGVCPTISATLPCGCLIYTLRT